MIVVIGHPIAAAGALDGPRPAGTAVRAALEAARQGPAVELLGTVGDDPTGDALLLALGAGGVGHVALLRDATRPTPLLSGHPEVEAQDAAADDDVEPPDESVEPADPARRPSLEPADVELGLRYLPDYRVIVVAEPLDAEIVRVAAEAAAYAGAALIVVGDPAAPAPELPPEALVVQAPAGPDVEALGSLLGRVAAAADGGLPASEAIEAVLREMGARPSS